MFQTVSLDSKTIIIKADTESDLSEIVEFISKKDKQKSLDTLLNFAAGNKIIDKNYKFDRNECYEFNRR